MPDQQTIVVTGGGTGGHIFPALAIAEALRRQAPEVNVLYVGGAGKMEARLVPERGIEFLGVHAEGLQRSVTFRNVLRNIAMPVKVLDAVVTCLGLISSRRVVGVIGTGGYASLPMLVAARLRGVPYVLNEQNALPGLVTRWMAGAAARVFLGMSDASNHLNINQKNVKITGNPVRGGLGSLTKAEACARLAASEGAALSGLDSARPIIAVLGGSLGAATLNEAVKRWAIIQGKAQEPSAIQVIWQAGERGYAQAKSLGTGYGENVHLTAFLKDMVAVYAASDLVVCRAGALTLSELVAAGKPALLVPSPNVTDDHQTHNARALERAGSALVVADAVAIEQLMPVAVALVSGDARLQVLRGMAGALQATVRLAPPAVEQIAADALDLFQIEARS